MITFYGPSFETKVAAGLGRTRRSRAPYSRYPEYGTEGVKLLRFATQRRAVLGASFLDSHDSNGHFNPQAGLSGGVRASL